MALYVFDKDNTLVQTVKTRMGIPRFPLKPEEQVLIPGVFEKLAKLRAQGHKIALASNQTNVARGLISIKEARAMMENVAAKVGGVDAWTFCPYDPKAKVILNGKRNPYCRDDPSRKPHPGMILEMMSKLGCQSRDTIVVGDASMDRKAAHAAGARFIPAKKFFEKP